MAARLPELEVPKLDGFEVWDRTVNTPAGQGRKVAWVSLLMSGGIGLNRAAREMLPPCEAVRLMYDPKGRRIGFVVTDPEAENSYEVRYTSGTQIQCRKFLEWYGLEVSETTRYTDLRVIDGVLVVDLGGESYVP